jgi:hypothetical protein
MSAARPLRRRSALQAAASRDATPPRAVHARAGGHGAAALGPLGGERGREQSGGLFAPASARSAKGAQ